MYRVDRKEGARKILLTELGNLFYKEGGRGGDCTLGKLPRPAPYLKIKAIKKSARISIQFICSRGPHLQSLTLSRGLSPIGPVLIIGPSIHPC